MSGVYFVIEVPKGQLMSVGWVYPASRGMWERVYLTFDAAKDQVDRLAKYSNRKGLRWVVVEAGEWLESATGATALYEELGR